MYSRCNGETVWTDVLPDNISAEQYTDYAVKRKLPMKLGDPKSD